MKQSKIRQSNKLFHRQENEDSESSAGLLKYVSNVTLEALQPGEVKAAWIWS